MNKLNLFEAFKKLDIQENTSDIEGRVLIELANKVGKGGCIFVEIGSWKGKTAAVLAYVASKYDGIVYTIDHFMGNIGTGRDNVAEIVDLFSIFRTNMRTLGFWQTTVKPLVMDSISASKIFKEASIDLLFIDAGHTYTEIYQDIKIWLPKVKRGGIICGHDCQEYYLDFQEEVDAKYETIDCGVSDKYGKQVHFAVIKAVYDHFGNNYKIIKPTSIWVNRG
jgi:predicted O-methyltransferase YrrM